MQPRSRSITVPPTQLALSAPLSTMNRRNSLGSVRSNRDRFLLHHSPYQSAPLLSSSCSSSSLPHPMTNKNFHGSINSSSLLHNGSCCSRPPCSQRRGSIGAATIVQRSGSKTVKSALAEIQRACQQDRSSSRLPLPPPLQELTLLHELSVDSYYRVIIRKYRGFEILQQVLNVFGGSDCGCNATASFSPSSLSSSSCVQVVIGLVHKILNTLDEEQEQPYSSTPSSSVELLHNGEGVPKGSTGCSMNGSSSSSPSRVAVELLSVSPTTTATSLLSEHLTVETAAHRVPVFNSYRQSQQ